MRRLLTTLALLLVLGAPTALPVQATSLPVPLPAPEAFTRYTTTAAVSNAAPRQNSTVTVSGTLKSAGKPVARVPMTATWYYKTTASLCTGVTNTAGVASCSRRISCATKGYPVRVTLTIGPLGKRPLSQVVTSFTPR